MRECMTYPMRDLQILIIGGGGREHALAWAAARSAQVARVFVAPGNAGTALEARVENIRIAADDLDALAKFAADKRIDLTIVGPEAPLVAGLADRFAADGLACFGPTAAAAQLEGSKTFAKDFMRRHAIPTAAYSSFTDTADAIAALDDFAVPVVVKADGLAAGKGVVVAASRAEARAAIESMLCGARHGAAGRRVVVEEFIEGEEVSFICMSDGEALLPLASSQDHKAAHDGDAGPNTGGMGALSPAPRVDAALHARVMDTVMRPAVAGMAADGAPYRGFLYAGLMLGDDGAPRVLEFNCRLGDPEAQPILMRLRSDLVAHCLAATRGELAGETAHWSDACALGVVMAAAGYPGDYRRGDVIRGLDGGGDGGIPRHPRSPHHRHPRSPSSGGGDDGGDGDRGDGDGSGSGDGGDGDGDTQSRCKVFHAGTAFDASGNIITAGGRVLCATATARTMFDAQTAAYQTAATIDWQGHWHRHDIGHRALGD